MPIIHPAVPSLRLVDEFVTFTGKRRGKEKERRRENQALQELPSHRGGCCSKKVIIRPGRDTNFSFFVFEK